MTALSLQSAWQTLRPIVNAFALTLGIAALCFIAVFSGIVGYVIYLLVSGA